MHPQAHDSIAPLSDAHVAIVGLGGLGTPAARALASEGVGTLALWDPDAVERSNLHRQLLYSDGDLGRPKVTVASERLVAEHPGLRIQGSPRRFTVQDAPLLSAAHVVIDGTDSVEAKFVVNDAAVAAGVPLVHAGAVGLRAQLLTVLPGTTACYRCIFEDAPPPGDLPSCQEAGVLGPLVNLTGALQAAEAVRLLLGVPPFFADRIVSIDVWTGTSRCVPVARREHCPACGTSPAGTRSES